MINLKELRVGNIVLYTEDNDELPVLKIDGDSKTVCLDLLLGLNMELNEQDIDPIPLTPEWLERCGCVRCPPSEDRWQYEMELPNNNQLEYDNTTLRGWSFNGVCLPKDPQYVHQLQNLYFALTGEELAIKET